jgi:outer membrane lipoprotein SlyB
LVFPFCLLPGLLALCLAGCSQGYSPNTYAANAAQQEAAVQRGTIIGVRQVMINADGTVGEAAGGAAGGVAGAQIAGDPVVTAIGAIGGTLVGGIGGSAAAQAVGDVKGWEYIVDEEPGDKLVSVTQTSKTALPLGLHVLVIAGSQQARIVPDYTVQVAAAVPAPKPAASATKPAAAAGDAAPVEIDIGPIPPAPDAASPWQIAPGFAGVDDPAAPAPTPVAADPAAAPAAPTTSGTAAAPASSSGSTATPAAASSASPAKATPAATSSATPVPAAPAAPKAAATP